MTSAEARSLRLVCDTVDVNAKRGEAILHSSHFTASIIDLRTSFKLQLKFVFNYVNLFDESCISLINFGRLTAPRNNSLQFGNWFNKHRHRYIRRVSVLADWFVYWSRRFRLRLVPSLCWRRALRPENTAEASTDFLSIFMVVAVGRRKMENYPSSNVLCWARVNAECSC